MKKKPQCEIDCKRKAREPLADVKFGDEKGCEIIKNIKKNVNTFACSYKTVVRLVFSIGGSVQSSFLPDASTRCTSQLIIFRLTELSGLSGLVAFKVGLTFCV